MQGRIEAKAAMSGFAAGALGWLAGAALQLQQPALWPAAVYAAPGLAGMVFVLVGRRRWPLIALGAALLAFALAGGRAGVRLADALPAALEGQDLVLTGVITQMPRYTPNGTRFVFAVEDATQQGRPVTVPQRVALGWYRGFDGDALLSGPGPELRAGQRWRFTVRLRQPHGTLNPHGFDLELWLFEKGIRASGTVRAVPGAVAEQLADAVGHPFERARQTVRDRILLQVPDPMAAGVLAALAVGDQAAILVAVNKVVFSSPRERPLSPPVV